MTLCSPTPQLYFLRPDFWPDLLLFSELMKPSHENVVTFSLTAIEPPSMIIIPSVQNGHNNLYIYDLITQGCHSTGKTGNLDAHFSRRENTGNLPKILKACFFSQENVEVSKIKRWVEVSKIKRFKLYWNPMIFWLFVFKFWVGKVGNGMGALQLWLERNYWNKCHFIWGGGEQGILFWSECGNPISLIRFPTSTEKMREAFKVSNFKNFRKLSNFGWIGEKLGEIRSENN